MPLTVAQRKRFLRERGQDRKSRKSLDSSNSIHIAGFLFGEINVTVIVDKDENIWFKGEDLGRALEMKDPNTAVSTTINKKYCESYEALTSPERKDIPGFQPKTTFVNEIGTNMFILRSRMPLADFFAEWVYRVVIKSLRKMMKGNEEVEPANNSYRDTTEFLKKQNEGLIKRNEELVNDLRRYTQQLFEMKPSCVPKLDNEAKQECFVLYKKNSRRDPFPYYACRVQLDSLHQRWNELLFDYPDLENLLLLSVPNSVIFFNYILEQMPKFIERGGRGQSFRINNISEEQMLTMIKNLYRTLHHHGGVMENILKKNNNC